MDNKINVREMVVDMLLEVIREGTHSHILLKQVQDKYNYIQESDKAWIKRAFEGTLERMITIDYVLNSYSDVKVNKMKPFIRSLMRMSVYQILFMDRVPDSAAINEAVKLAKKRKFVNLSGFVNGVLRAIVRDKDKLSKFDDPGIQYSLPQIIVESLITDYGRDKALSIMEESLKDRHLCVRIREDIKAEDRMRVIGEWEEKHITFRQLSMLDYAYELFDTEGLGRFECWQEGLYTVQDVASMMVCEKAGITGDVKVIDVCAAPGGKCLHAASKGAVVDARDVSEMKTGLIEENIARLHAENITVKIWDATIEDKEAIESADILIADVPCSGLGVMGKKPDIKQNASKEGWQSIEELQKKIVDTVWRYVKPGGTMMYSTCTLRKAENEKMTEYIVTNYPFELVEEKTYFPCSENDGFYIAKLERKNG